jgi:multisubunit Na+/H+ antiporter MnhB subunit
MSVEQLLRESLHRADDYDPSPDLFARVQRSIEEDRAHRRRIRRVWLAVVAGVAVVVAYLAVMAEPLDGTITWPWWSLELLTTAVLLVIVLVLGPLIRRFGRIYAADVFRANPPTGDRFLALLDVAYYLVFVAMILLTASVSPEPAWLGPDGLTSYLEHAFMRVGDLLLVMGLLHSVTIMTLPVLGLVFTDGWRRLPPGQDEASSRP